ncbi:hypothetical protein O6H91_01G007700 [Diphasiastrum complanatum]|uniref:Uncharacterized protein n=1 Tax=Diphasiastrum complanatum TaxID=34168 RepID=A0ACC2EMU6_DIPCM|nr:hypothetical protein O6H91_01G007700 [Diphasiastrum complanatum]
MAFPGLRKEEMVLNTGDRFPPCLAFHWGRLCIPGLRNLPDQRISWDQCVQNSVHIWFSHKQMENGCTIASSSTICCGGISGWIAICSGGLLTGGSLTWAEVYDPLVDKWSVVTSPVELRQQRMYGYATLDKKLIAFAGTGGVVFDPASASCICA